MNVPVSLKPAKKGTKKALTKKQMVQIMTKRKACIDKFRKTLKAKTTAVVEKSAKEISTQEKPKKSTLKGKKKEVSISSAIFMSKVINII